MTDFWKSLLKSVLIHLLVLGIGFGGGFYVAKTTHNCPQIDTTYENKTDTLWLPQDTLKIPILYPPQIAEEVSDSVYKTKFDTTFTVGNDTITSEKEIFFDEGTKEFTLIENIEARTYEMVTVDTVFSEFVKEVEIYIEPPFYNTFTFGAIVGLVFTLILGVLF